MFRKITAEVTAVGLALTVLASAAQVKATELTEAQMDQITAGAFQVVGAKNLLDSSNNLYIRQADPTQYLVGTVVWSGNLTFFNGTPTTPGLPAVTPYAVGTLIGPGGQMNTGGFVVAPGYPIVGVLGVSGFGADSSNSSVRGI